MKIFMGKNLSCDLNYQDQEIFLDLCEFHEMVDDPSIADVIIFAGTCSGSLRNLKATMKYIHDVVEKKKDGAKVYLTGCLTREFIDKELQQKVERFLHYYIDVVIPQNHPLSLAKEIAKEYADEEEVFGACFYRERFNRNELYLSNGCANHCTFCKTSFQKYPVTSMPFEIAKQCIDEADDSRVEKLNVLGTNLCQYGLDTEGMHLLPELIRYIDTKKHIKHIQLIGYAFQDAIHHGFLELFPESDKHYTINGSLESGSNRILELMKKGFTREEIIAFIEQLRTKANIDIYTNIIAGFPTETIDDIKQTLDALRKIQALDVAVCRYSDSPFVASHALEQLSEEEKNRHARIYDRALTKSKINHNLNW